MKIRALFPVIVCGLALAFVGRARGDPPGQSHSQRVFKVGVLASLTGLWSSLGQDTCNSIVEIMRVTREEARIYPTVTFEAQPSENIPMLRSDLALQRFEFTEVETDFEFLVNSNSS